MADEQNSTKLVRVLDFGNNEKYEINATKLNDRDDYVTRDELSTNLAKGVRYMGTLPRTVEGMKVYTTPAAKQGDLYIITEPCTINNTVVCDIRDWWLCVVDSVAEGVNTGWDRVQGDIDLDALDDKYADAAHTHNITVNDGGGFTPTGTITAPTFTGDTATLKHTVTVYGGSHTHTTDSSAKALKHTITKQTVSATGSYTPAGKVTVTHTPAGNVTTTAHSHSVSFNQNEGAHTHSVSATGTHTPAGSVTITAAGVNGSYTPAGTVNSGGGHTHDFTGTPIEYTPAGTVAESGAHTHTVTASGSYTPAGTVKYNEVTGVTLSGGTAQSVVAGIATKPKNTNAVAYASYDSTTQTLKFNTFGALTDVTVTPASITVPTVATPVSAEATGTFTGTAATISVTGTAAQAGAHTHSFNGTADTLDVAGDISTVGGHTHTFSGTKATMTAAFEGTQATLTVNGTAASNGAHKHTSGTTNAVEVEAAFEGTLMSKDFTISGTEATITVNGSADIAIADHSITTVDSIGPASPGISVTVADHSYKPTGTISAPTFKGNAVAAHTHNASASTPV